METTAFCDAACVFCPYPTMKRSKGTMSMEMFKKIIDEAATLPLIDHITFTGLGESLLDKHLVERIRYTRSILPNVRIDMFTNGSQLTEEKIDELFDAKLSVLYVSLNGTNARKRKEIMYPHKPGYDDYDQVCAMIDYAVAKYKREGGTVVMAKAIVSKDLFEIGDQEKFIERWNGIWEQGGNAFMHLEGNWAGAVWKARTTQTTPCSRALGMIMVLWDGRVSACCFDGEGEEILGDLKTQGLREMYNAPRATDFRLAHHEGRREEIPLCAGCTAI